MTKTKNFNSGVFLSVLFILALNSCSSTSSSEKEIIGHAKETQGQDLLHTLEDQESSPDQRGDFETSDMHGEDFSTAKYPEKLPFEFTRPDEGNPLSDAEIASFTSKITGFFKKTRFFDWIWWTSHGLDKSCQPDMPDYKLYWQDTKSVKQGNTVRFVHTGGADNLALRTAKLLENAGALYLMTGDYTFGRVVEQYAKGFVALSKGLEWETEEPVVKYLQARAIFTLDHEYEVEKGRKVKVEYGPVKQEKKDWNAHTIPNMHNPYWGRIWVRTMRSKDDVPHIYRAIPLLMRIAETGKHKPVREAAALALEYLQGFAKDIVDSGYYIRTKDKNGNPFIPVNEDGTVKDLASFVNYDALIPNAECSGKLSSALVAYADPLDLDCGENDYNLYEKVATDVHYFNYAIIRYFHLACITNSLMTYHNDIAYALLQGLAKRIDRYMNDQKAQAKHPEWNADLAAYLLACAASGLPLTSKEARLVMEQYSASAEHYEAFAYWDPWANTVPDGEFPYKPSRWGPSDPQDPDSPKIAFVRLPEMTFIFEYCYSPFKNPSGAPILDCSVVADPSRWGE